MAGVAAIVVAAGQGVRAGGDLPKQFRRLGGDTLLQRALSAFTGVAAVSLVQPVIRPDDLALVRMLVDGMDVLPPVSGGATRQASVLASRSSTSRRSDTAAASLRANQAGSIASSASSVSTRKAMREWPL